MRSRRINDNRIACVAPSLAVRSCLRQQGSHHQAAATPVRKRAASSQQPGCFLLHPITRSPNHPILLDPRSDIIPISDGFGGRMVNGPTPTKLGTAAVTYVPVPESGNKMRLRPFSPSVIPPFRRLNQVQGYRPVCPLLSYFYGANMVGISNKHRNGNRRLFSHVCHRCPYLDGSLRSATFASSTILVVHFVSASSQHDPVLVPRRRSSTDENSTLYSTLVRVPTCFHRTLVGIVTSSVPDFFPKLSWKPEADLNAFSSASLSRRVNPSSPPHQTSTGVAVGLVDADTIAPATINDRTTTIVKRVPSMIICCRVPNWE
jgi:hypothetical protein